MSSTFHRILLVATLVVPMAASAQNVLTNGSFESGLTGWTATAPLSSNPVTVVTYGTTGSTFGEAIPVDNATGGASPDAAGTHAAYFYSDTGTLTLSQTFVVPVAGSYNFGLSFYVPFNGAANPFDAAFSALIGVGSFNAAISSLNVGAWEVRGSGATLAAGSHTATFSFTGAGNAAKDILIDRIYVTSAIPEPGSYAMMLAGLGAMGFIARRRRRS